MVIRRTLGLFLFFLITAQIHAQNIQNTDSGKGWYKIYNQKLSSDGLWSYYLKRYDNDSTEGVLINTKTKKTFTLDHVGPVLLNKHFFLAQQKGGNAVYITLNTARQKSIPTVRNFYGGEGNTALVVTTSGEWFIMDKNGRMTKKGAGISQSVLYDQDRLVLLYSNEGTILYDLKVQTIIMRTIFTAENILAQDHDAISKISRFLIQRENNLLVYTYSWRSDESSIISVPSLSSEYRDYSFAGPGKLVATKPTTQQKETSVEVWHHDDAVLKPYSDRKRAVGYDAVIIDYHLGVAHTYPHSDAIVHKYLVFGDRYLLEVDDEANDHFTTEFVIPKIALKKLGDNAEEFTVPATRFYAIADDSQSLFYFTENHWYLYDAIKKDTINITATIPDDFRMNGRNGASLVNPVSHIYFSEDFSAVYLTGRENIWKMNVKTKAISNLTKNHQPDFSYSIIAQGSGRAKKLQWSDTRVVDENCLLLRGNSSDGLSEALFLFNGKKMKTIKPPNHHHFDQFVKNKDFISFTRESFNEPWQLTIYDKVNASEETIPYSRPKTDLSTAELLRWVNNEKNQEFLAIVLPPNYDPSISYPSIVRVYENEARSLKYFEYPTFYNQAGFNASLYASKGYIILYPNIRYRTNEVGQSALSSVMSAIDVAASRYSIDRSRLGIIGHSFGGFETNYIISQTSAFKAAISGASVSNIFSSYFRFSPKYLRPDIWRYTDQSMRFAGDFYQLKEEYMKNNPIYFADQITTPVLIWSGAEDEHVEWKQSVSLFIALKSLRKEAKLMLFRGETHTLEIRDQQRKATEAFLKWFNTFLKPQV